VFNNTSGTQPAEVKICAYCGQAMRWYRNGKHRNGGPQYKWKCNSCDNRRKKEHNPHWMSERKIRVKQRNPDYGKREQARRLERRKRNGLSVKKEREVGPRRKHYLVMQGVQNGVCAICGNNETRIQRGKVCKLANDHNHVTDQLRGLLCSKCNSGLGFFNDDPDRLRAAAGYLERWQQEV
jgi:hypothetical protein